MYYAAPIKPLATAQIENLPFSVEVAPTGEKGQALIRISMSGDPFDWDGIGKLMPKATNILEAMASARLGINRHFEEQYRKQSIRVGEKNKSMLIKNQNYLAPDDDLKFWLRKEKGAHKPVHVQDYLIHIDAAKPLKEQAQKLATDACNQIPRAILAGAEQSAPVWQEGAMFNAELQAGKPSVEEMQWDISQGLGGLYKDERVPNLPGDKKYRIKDHLNQTVYQTCTNTVMLVPPYDQKDQLRQALRDAGLREGSKFNRKPGSDYLEVSFGGPPYFVVDAEKLASVVPDLTLDVVVGQTRIDVKNPDGSIPLKINPYTGQSVAITDEGMWRYNGSFSLPPQETNVGLGDFIGRYSTENAKAFRTEKHPLLDSRLETQSDKAEILGSLVSQDRKFARAEILQTGKKDEVIVRIILSHDTALWPGIKEAMKAPNAKAAIDAAIKGIGDYFAFAFKNQQVDMFIAANQNKRNEAGDTMHEYTIRCHPNIDPEHLAPMLAEQVLSFIPAGIIHAQKNSQWNKGEGPDTGDDSPRPPPETGPRKGR